MKLKYKIIFSLLLTLKNSTILATDGHFEGAATILSSPLSAYTSLKITNPQFFSEEELIEIETGYRIIEQRIETKEDILSHLKNNQISLVDKKRLCYEDFGVFLHTTPIITSATIEEGINAYCNYLTNIIDAYKTIRTYTQAMLQASTLQEKKNYQNNIFYFLSSETKHFKTYITTCFKHEIPEHSLEDTFYEMICSRICESASKEYDILNNYLLFQVTPLGTKKEIDNERLMEVYKNIHKNLINNFQTCPLFFLSSIDTKNEKINKRIKNIIEPFIEKINSKLNICGEKFISITENFKNKVENYNKTQFLNKENDIILMYQVCGPWLLEAIQGYEEISCTIKKLEIEAINFLSKFKKEDLSFRKLPLDAKSQINAYLQNQEEMAKKAAVAQREAEHQKQKKEQEEKKRAREKIAQKIIEKNLPSFPPQDTQTSIIAKENHVQQLDNKPKALSHDNSDLKSPSNNELLLSVNAQSSSTLDNSPDKELPEIPQEKKVKVKTRPVQVTVMDALTVNQENPDQGLPEQFTNPNFPPFVKNLLKERDERIMKSLFKKLSSNWGIHAENTEKKNKGYFAIRSPLTGLMHVRTYHHLHANNHYASIFMALRQVLIAADIIER